mgnify:CR=1 FL=1
MIVAIARPQALVTLPSQHETIILAMDVSGSMRATDVEPNRLAARAGGGARVRQRPAAAHADRRRVVRRHGCRGAAADAHARRHHRRDRPLPAAARHRGRQRHPGVAEDDLPRRRVRLAVVESARRPIEGDAARQQAGRSGQSRGQAGAARLVTRRPAIILLTDGQTTTGPDPIEAARMAGRARRARLHGRHRHRRGRDDRRRRLVDARAPRRGVAEADRHPRAASISTPGLAAELRRSPTDAELADGAGTQGNRDPPRCFAAAAHHGAGALLSALLSLYGSIASARSSVQSRQVGSPRDSEPRSRHEPAGPPRGELPERVARRKSSAHVDLCPRSAGENRDRPSRGSASRSSIINHRRFRAHVPARPPRRRNLDGPRRRHDPSRWKCPPTPPYARPGRRRELRRAIAFSACSAGLYRARWYSNGDEIAFVSTVFLARPIGGTLKPDGEETTRDALLYRTPRWRRCR